MRHGLEVQLAEKHRKLQEAEVTPCGWEEASHALGAQQAQECGELVAPLEQGRRLREPLE